MLPSQAVSSALVLLDHDPDALTLLKKRALGKKALALAGKVHVAQDVNDMIEEGRRD
jgi:hypothetical protein